MRVIPLSKDDVDRCVSNFHAYSDEIRMNIPELILATMESIHMKYKKVKLERKGAFVHGQTADTVSHLLKIARTRLVCNPADIVGRITLVRFKNRLDCVISDEVGLYF